VHKFPDRPLNTLVYESSTSDFNGLKHKADPGPTLRRFSILKFGAGVNDYIITITFVVIMYSFGAKILCNITT